MKQTKLNYDQALEYINSPNHNPYGTDRVYGTIASGENAGQVVAIKSQYQLDRFEYSNIYINHRENLSIPTK